MGERVRSPLLRHGPEYSMSYQQGNPRGCRYPPRDGYEYSPSYRRSPNNRRDPRYSLPRGLRDRGSRYSHGSSSGYGELERSRCGAGDVNEPRERRDYGRDLDGGRGRQLVELARYNEDLGRGDTASMKFQWDHLSNHSERVNVEAGLGTVNPNVSMEGTDYRTHIDEDRDKQSSKMSNPNEGLPPRDLQYAMFQGKHVLGKSERITSNSSHNPKYFLEYGRSRNHHDSRFEGLGSSRMIMEKPIYPKTDLKFSTYIPRSSNKRSYPDVGAGGSNVPTKKISVGLHQDEKIRLHDDLSHEKLYGDRSQSYINERGIPRFSLKDETTRMYSREEKNPRYYLREEKLYSSYGERESQFSLKDTLPHEIPLSQYKGSTADPFGCSIIDLCCSNKDSLLVGSDAYGRSSGYPTEPLPVKNSNSVMEDASNYMKDNKLSPNVGTHVDYSYSTAWRSDYTEINPLLDKPYEKLSISKDDNRHIDPLGSRIMDPILDGYSSRREHLAEERLRDALCSPLGRIVPSYLDAPGSSYAIGSVEGLGRGEIDLGYEGDIYQDHENKSSREDYGYGQDEGLQPHDEKTSSYMRDYYSYGQDAGLQEESAEKRANSYMLKDYDHVYDRIDHVFDGDYCDPLEGTNIKDVGVLTQPKDVFTRRRAIRDRICINRNISSKARGSRPNKSLFGGPRYRNPWVYNGIVQPRQYKAFESEGGSAGKERALNPRVRDIKKRLGPTRPVGRIVAKPLVKKQKNWKVSRKNEDDDGEGSVQAEKEGPPEHGAETAKSEPPEKSEEFKQLVRSAFFKFIRQLNENLVELKKFKGQGKSGSLRCWVCGRSVFYIRVFCQISYLC